jgi:ribosomal protein S18 acetylase RimI-like enzyme
LQREIPIDQLIEQTFLGTATQSRNHLTLRRAKEEDADFAFRVLKETMQEYVVATWGSWREDESRRETDEQVSSGRTEVIELNGLPIGVQLVDRPGTHIQLVQLYIAKEFQRRGFGTQLLKRLLIEAGESKLSIRLRVLVVNPARALYERLGFVVVGRTPERLLMEWGGLEPRIEGLVMAPLM